MSVISKVQFEKVSSFFRELDENHPKMKVQNKLSPVDEKIIRYESYASLGLVRVDDYSSVLFGEWVTRDEARGLDVHDPVVWLEKIKKQKEKRKN